MGQLLHSQVRTRRRVKMDAQCRFWDTHRQENEKSAENWGLMYFLSIGQGEKSISESICKGEHRTEGNPFPIPWKNIKFLNK